MVTKYSCVYLFAIFLMTELFFIFPLNSQTYNLHNTTQTYILEQQSKDVVNVLNENGHDNLIFTTLDYNDIECYHMLLYLLLNSNGTYTIPSKNGAIPRAVSYTHLTLPTKA